MTDDDRRIARLLRETRTIAMVGASANPIRPSFLVGTYLTRRGYRVIPVNPGLAPAPLFGVAAVASLAEIAEPVDMVDIFRRSEQVGPIVDAALAAFPGLRAIWMQIGVVNDAAAAVARARGVEVVMNRCPKIERQRLFGELRMGGFATGVISSRL